MCHSQHSESSGLPLSSESHHCLGGRREGGSRGEEGRRERRGKEGGEGEEGKEERVGKGEMRKGE